MKTRDFRILKPMTQLKAIAYLRKALSGVSQTLVSVNDLHSSAR